MIADRYTLKVTTLQVSTNNSLTQPNFFNKLCGKDVLFLIYAE